MSSNACQTNSTACSSEIMKRVILTSVMGSLPVPASDMKKGITDPRDPMTLPYLTTAKRVICTPAYALLATNNLSDASLDAPYKFAGLLALSEDSAITPLTF
ncbi:MAG: hypothetical protein EWM72_01836 [Nitrospira sp.]|nr:MAG: hypothetical protein EWM72_01836 [Nitrospira sp.]